MLWQIAVEVELEGVIAKDGRSAYRTGHSTRWQKIKTLIGAEPERGRCKEQTPSQAAYFYAGLNGPLTTFGATEAERANITMFHLRIRIDELFVLATVCPLASIAGPLYTLSVLDQLRRLVLITLLVVIPGQGTAALLHAFTCEPHGVVASTEVAGHASHSHGHAAASDRGHSATQKHDHYSSQAGSDSAQDQCCYQVPAATTVYASPAPRGLPVYLSLPPVLEISFVLEQPQRPPRV